MATVAVIGTAGRDKDSQQLNADIFHKMCEIVPQIIMNIFELDLKNVILVSGGAAWSDHVAVKLWLEHQALYKGLVLHLPTRLSEESMYIPTRIGMISNRLHESFSHMLQFDSVRDLREVRRIARGSSTKYPKMLYHAGFYSRNRAIAESEYLIAFSWNKGKEPFRESGTGFTWKLAKNATKLHVPLTLLLEPDPSCTKKRKLDL